MVYDPDDPMRIRNPADPYRRSFGGSHWAWGSIIGAILVIVGIAVSMISSGDGELAALNGTQANGATDAHPKLP